MGQGGQAGRPRQGHPVGRHGGLVSQQAGSYSLPPAHEAPLPSLLPRSSALPLPPEPHHAPNPAPQHPMPPKRYSDTSTPPSPHPMPRHPGTCSTYRGANFALRTSITRTASETLEGGGRRSGKHWGCLCLAQAFSWAHSTPSNCWASLGFYLPWGGNEHPGSWALFPALSRDWGKATFLLCVYALLHRLCASVSPLYKGPQWSRG